MRRTSLRLRLVAGGLVAILLALSITGGGIVLLFERHIARSLADDLDVHLKQLLAGIDVDRDGRLVVTRAPADPRFADPLSGLYWQVSGGPETLRSRSLWDTVLALPPDEPAPGEVHRHEISGPGNARMLATEQIVRLALGDGRMPVRVVVAADLARVATAASAFARDLASGLALLAVTLAVATSVQVGLGLRPLDALRRGIAEIRAERQQRLPRDVPAEVRPLVEEVNALLDAQEREIERSRSRAADLAHGLKTPLAALAADAARLRERGETALATEIENLGNAMSRHVDRELARARVRGGLRPSAGSTTALAPLVRSLVATLARTSGSRAVSFESRIADDQQVRLDRTDLAEVLGNLLENAARHARSHVRIAADDRSITIEDDGAGIAPAELQRVLARGVQLDRRGDGAGLGLAIVCDVLDAYGWRLELGQSELGGVKATIAPSAPALSPHGKSAAVAAA